MGEEATVETELEVKRADELLRAGKAQLIDVRQDYEWEAGRIEGARHVEINELAAEARSISKEQPVIFYCRGGSRSALAAEAFRQAGFQAYNMAGGLRAWADEGLPLIPADGKVADSRPAS